MHFFSNDFYNEQFKIVELVEFSPFPSLHCMSDGIPRPTYRQDGSDQAKHSSSTNTNGCFSINFLVFVLKLELKIFPGNI